ncbi:MAG: phosphate/phosphite/phosphonate ABC transporter substrate-binding protein [Candidatus Thiodiazotropha sp.]|jgi:phosphonate transport system substrate-binding protein
MPYQMTVSPDFTPDHISSWYIFNTWLQRSLNKVVHLELYDGFEQQRQAILSDQVDLIYANPYDAAVLVRQKGFLPIVKPQRASDEAVIVVHDSNPAQQVEELKTGINIATTDDPDVNLICQIMLEPAELNTTNTQRISKNTYPLVAKALIKQEVDLGFFLLEAYESLSKITRRELRPLVSSQIQVIHHALFAGPRLREQRSSLCNLLMQMPHDPKGAGVLRTLGFEAWEPMEDEEMEFMIDLMDTLNYQPA